VIANKFIN